MREDLQALSIYDTSCFHRSCTERPLVTKRQPLMPVTINALVSEGIECARAGASVIHIHVYDPDTGHQFEDFDAYRAVIEGIREVEDVIVYPTLPLSDLEKLHRHPRQIGALLRWQNSHRLVLLNGL